MISIIMGNCNVTNLILENIYLVLLLPLWLFLIIMIGRFFSVYLNKSLIYIFTLFSSLIGIIYSSVGLLTLGADKIVEHQIPIIKIENFILYAGIQVDRQGCKQWQHELQQIKSERLVKYILIQNYEHYRMQLH